MFVSIKRHTTIPKNTNKLNEKWQKEYIYNRVLSILCKLHRNFYRCSIQWWLLNLVSNELNEGPNNKKHLVADIRVVGILSSGEQKILLKWNQCSNSILVMKYNFVTTAYEHQKLDFFLL